MPEPPKLEVFSAIEELGKLGSFYLMREVFYPEVIESRCINLGQDVLQVLATTSVVKPGESRKDGLHREILSTFAWIWGRRILAERDGKSFEFGQRGQGYNYSLR
jgi:hypothetical protein